MIYSATDWFWYVGGDQTRAYSSAARAYLPAGDAAVQAHLAAGKRVTAIASEDELRAVLADQYPQGWQGATRWTPLEFLARFTDAEQAGIAQASLSSAQIMLFMMRVSGATYIDASDLRTQQGVQAMAGIGLLTPERATQVLDANAVAPTAVSLDVANIKLTAR